MAPPEFSFAATKNHLDSQSQQGERSRPSMKLILLSCCVAVLLFQGGCAIPPPIEQQSLEQNNRAQQEKKSDAFANGLQQ